MGLIEEYADKQRLAAFRDALIKNEIGRIEEFRFVESPFVEPLAFTVRKSAAVGVSVAQTVVDGLSDFWVRRMVSSCIDASDKPKAMPPAYPSMASGMWSLRKPVAAAAARVLAGARGMA